MVIDSRFSLMTLLLGTLKQQLDPETFATLFEHARPSLRVIAGAECGFAHADDAVQQGAITAMKRIKTFTPGTDFNAWAAAIVRNTAKNTRRGELALFAEMADYQPEAEDEALPLRVVVPAFVLNATRPSPCT